MKVVFFFYSTHAVEEILGKTEDPSAAPKHGPCFDLADRRISGA